MLEAKHLVLAVVSQSSQLRKPKHNKNRNPRGDRQGKSSSSSKSLILQCAKNGDLQSSVMHQGFTVYYRFSVTSKGLLQVLKLRIFVQCLCLESDTSGWQLSQKMHLQSEFTSTLTLMHYCCLVSFTVNDNCDAPLSFKTNHRKGWFSKCIQYLASFF